MDLQNNADIVLSVLSHAHNLQFTTIYVVWASCARGWKFNSLQILGCELHKNAFGGRAPHRPSGELYRSPRCLAVIRGRGKERVGNSRKGKKGREGAYLTVRSMMCSRFHHITKSTLLESLKCVCTSRKLEERRLLPVSSCEDGELEPGHAQLQSTVVCSQHTDDLAPSATAHICNSNALSSSAEIIGMFIPFFCNENCY